MSARRQSARPAKAPRRAASARLAAVQALYQMDLAETDLAAVHRGVQGASAGRASAEADGTGAEADPEHFAARAEGRRARASARSIR